MVANNTSTSLGGGLTPQYVYVGEGIHKIRTLANVDHVAIKSDFIKKVEIEGAALVREIIFNMAKSLRYDSPESLCSYAGYVNTYQKEAMSFIAWRGAIWDWVQTYNASVIAGTVVPPADLKTLIPSMPQFTNYIVV